MNEVRPMKIKKEFVILTVLIISLAGYLMVKKTDRVQYTLPTTPAITKNSTEKLELNKVSQQVTLTKKEGVWFVFPGDYPADTAKVDKILETLSHFTLDTLVSESGDYQRYDLTEDKKIGVSVFGDKDALFTFSVGKRAPTFKHTFVTVAGDKRIFQAQGNFRNDFDQNVQDLRDKNILPKDTVTSIEISEGGKILALKKKAAEKIEDAQKTNPSDADTTPHAGWVDGSGGKIPETAIHELLTQLAGLQCDSYLEGKTKEGFKNPILSISLLGETSANLSIFNKTDPNDKGNPGISSSNNYPFLLQSYKIELIRKALGEIRGDGKEVQNGTATPAIRKTIGPNGSIEKSSR
jgi:hypothetical protein